jgi:hypothetical protein
LPRFTITLKRPVVAFALVSVAEHLTKERPILKRLPDLGWQETGTDPSTASLAVTL